MENYFNDSLNEKNIDEQFGEISSLLNNENENINEKIVLDEETKNAIEKEVKKRFYSVPENQANELLKNYMSLHGNPGRLERRKLYREFLKRAKRGVYNSMFDEYVNKNAKETLIEDVAEK